ncbi:MAG TPA: protein phosphatase CheZ [Steroidobacteraceae bacterium]|jgi:chemotaxis protein CheZ|nr:protein phosphatase CheZ [Steroidobacteraceae bacterium]
MSGRLLDNSEFVSWLGAMSRALAEGNEEALGTALAGFEGVRNATVTMQVRRVASDLQFALDDFHANAKLVDMAQRRVPDARHRLAHVLRLTDDAAHRTMDLVERSAPLADHATHEADRLIQLQQQGSTAQQIAPQLTAFVTLVSASMGAVRSNLAEVLIAQGYQDLTGQIIRGVMKLTQELESSLADLLRIAGPANGEEAINATAYGTHGPAVPGVVEDAVGGQQDVDALLSQLGV